MGRAVEVIADRHVVGRNGLRHRSGCAADRKESPGHFLAGADLGERSVSNRIEVELQRLLSGTGSSVIHGMSRCVAVLAHRGQPAHTLLDLLGTVPLVSLAPARSAIRASRRHSAAMW